MRKLLVFSDDWGRHPSSCQHLVGQMLDRCDVLWVNTIGTRLPGLNRQDMAKAIRKIRQWAGMRQASAYGDALPENLQVISPKMYPGFRRRWQRSLNARWMASQINGRLRAMGWSSDQTTVLTTLPITADLPGRLGASRWVYYCVDDFSLWPGLDAQPMRAMEATLVRQVDAAVAVSPNLQIHLADLGRSASLLTHGVDLDFWLSDHGPALQTASSSRTDLALDFDGLPDWCRGLERPILLFWGLVDRRLDDLWCQRLAAMPHGTLVLVGPMQNPSPTVVRLVQAVSDRAVTRNALSGGAREESEGDEGGGARGARGGRGVRRELLPQLARWADVLVMPYADLPVTRAMQPLKFKEYLATGKPVVARNLPALASWADAADLADTVEQAVQAIETRLAHGVSESQKTARQRLVSESWSSKARQLEPILWPR